MMPKEKYLPTGNEIVSLPMIDENTAEIQNINFLHMGYRGLVEMHGCENPRYPFLKPYLVEDEKEILLSEGNLEWKRVNYWIPEFTLINNSLKIMGTYLTPTGERGFSARLFVENNSSETKEIFLGLRGSWQNSYHTINESKRLFARRLAYTAKWGGGMMLEQARETSLFCLGLHTSEPLDVESWKINNYPDIVSFKEGQGTISLDENNPNPIFFTLGKKIRLDKNENYELIFYFGLGLDEVGAATAALEMKRKGYSQILLQSKDWLDSRMLHLRGDQLKDKTPDETLKLEEIMNVNSFFNYFYSMGNTLDTEELVLVTSRSPRYYVSAAYWDRDILYWCLPAILLMDPKKGREILERVFERHIRNAGIHSHYIDGVVLEPGFELDELCAPVIALYRYLEKTGDRPFLDEPSVLKGLQHIEDILITKKHPAIELYETFLLPSDDPAEYPYVTYDNVLVWKMLDDLSEIYEVIGNLNKSIQYKEKANSVKKAIWDNCVYNTEFGWILVCSTDLKGQYQIYDDPPGSLQLLAYLGFCAHDESVYMNTMNYLHSRDYKYSFEGTNFPTLGCEHFPHPAIFSIVNDMLSYRVLEGRQLILKASMDNGIACESIDENTGECATGAAFATLAGFLAFAIYTSQVK